MRNNSLGRQTVGPGEQISRLSLNAAGKIHIIPSLDDPRARDDSFKNLGR